MVGTVSMLEGSWSWFARLVCSVGRGHGGYG